TRAGGGRPLAAPPRESAKTSTTLVRGPAFRIRSRLRRSRLLASSAATGRSGELPMPRPMLRLPTVLLLLALVGSGIAAGQDPAIGPVMDAIFPYRLDTGVLV